MSRQHHRGQRHRGQATLLALVEAEEESGTPRKQAIADVARRSGVPKRVVYDAVHR